MTINEVTERPLHILDATTDGVLSSQAFGVNDAGAAVGVVLTDKGSRAVLFERTAKGAQVTDLTPHARASIAEAINNDGVVAGTLGVGVKEVLQPPSVVDGEVLPFVWSEQDGLTVLPLPPGSEMGQAIDIDDAGTVLVTGAVPGSGALPRGLPVGSFLYDLERGSYSALKTGDDDDGLIALGHTLDPQGGVAGGLVKLEGEFDWRHTPAVWAAESLEPSRSKGDDAFVNARTTGEQAVGWQMTQPGQPAVAVQWSDPSTPPAPLPGVAALRISTAGVIVGIESHPESSGFPFAGVLWNSEGAPTPLAHLGAGSYAYGINDRGDVVGYVVDAEQDGGPVARATLWPVA